MAGMRLISRPGLPLVNGDEVEPIGNRGEPCWQVPRLEQVELHPRSRHMGPVQPSSHMHPPKIGVSEAERVVTIDLGGEQWVPNTWSCENV